MKRIMADGSETDAEIISVHNGCGGVVVETIEDNQSNTCCSKLYCSKCGKIFGEEKWLKKLSVQ